MLVIDEAGMLGTRQLAEILQHVRTAGAKLVLTGDHRQLPELEAGGCFRGLAIRLPYIGLRENRRQHAEWEQAALRELRHGDVEIALAEYRRRERIIVEHDANRLGERMVADWWSSGGPQGGIMIALRRTDVRRLNRFARDAMRRAGRLGEAEVSIDEERFSVGDFVILRHNDSRRGIANGERGIVTGAGESFLSVEICGRAVDLGPDYLALKTAHGDPAIAHGYAVTGHVAQGLTTDRAFVLASDELYREWAYTAMSRGRALNRLYMVDGAVRPRDEIAPRPKSSADAELLATVRQTRRQLMALDAGHDAVLLRKGTASRAADKPSPDDNSSKNELTSRALER